MEQIMQDVLRDKRLHLPYREDDIYNVDTRPRIPTLFPSSTKERYNNASIFSIIGMIFFGIFVVFSFAVLGVLLFKTFIIVLR